MESEDLEDRIEKMYKNHAGYGLNPNNKELTIEILKTLKNKNLTVSTINATLYECITVVAEIASF